MCQGVQLTAAPGKHVIQQILFLLRLLFRLLPEIHKIRKNVYEILRYHRDSWNAVLQGSLHKNYIILLALKCFMTLLEGLTTLILNQKIIQKMSGIACLCKWQNELLEKGWSHTNPNLFQFPGVVSNAYQYTTIRV